MEPFIRSEEFQDQFGRGVTGDDVGTDGPMCRDVIQRCRRGQPPARLVEYAARSRTQLMTGSSSLARTAAAFAYLPPGWGSERIGGYGLVNLPVLPHGEPRVDVVVQVVVRGGALRLRGRGGRVGPVRASEVFREQMPKAIISGQVWCRVRRTRARRRRRVTPPCQPHLVADLGQTGEVRGVDHRPVTREPEERSS